MLALLQFQVLRFLTTAVVKDEVPQFRLFTFYAAAGVKYGYRSFDFLLSLLQLQ